MLLLTSASACLNHSCNLGPTKPSPVGMQCPWERVRGNARGEAGGSHSYPQSKIGVCGCIATAQPCPYYCQLLKGQAPQRNHKRRPFASLKAAAFFALTSERGVEDARPRRLELEKQTRGGEAAQSGFALSEQAERSWKEGRGCLSALRISHCAATTNNDNELASSVRPSNRPTVGKASLSRWSVGRPRFTLP